MTAVIFTTTSGEYRTTVRFRYDPAIVSAIKTEVPAHAREWHPATKHWTVDTDWARVLAATLRRHGHIVTGIDEPQATHNHDGRTWAHALFTAVGRERAPAVHRALTKVLHPDNQDTGSHQLQQELNTARAEIECRSRAWRLEIR